MTVWMVPWLVGQLTTGDDGDCSLREGIMVGFE